MPSSFVSTATGVPAAAALAIAAATSGAVEASIGSTGRPTSSPNSASASSPPVIAATAIGTVRARRASPRGVRRPAGRRRPRDRLLDQRVQGALAEVAGDHAAQPALLVGRRPGEQVAHRGGPGFLRARPGHRGEPVEGLVDLERGDRGLGPRVGERAQAAPADAGAALQDRAAEVRRDHRQLVDLGLASRSAIAATLALRDRVAATALEVSTRSRRSMRSSCPSPPTSDLPGRNWCFPEDISARNIGFTAYAVKPATDQQTSLPDPGAHLVELGEERQVQRAAQEVDAGRPAGAGLVADGALHDLEVAEPPLLEVVLDVDELLAGLVDAPVLARARRRPRRRRRTSSGSERCGCDQSRSSSRPGRRTPGGRGRPGTRRRATARAAASSSARARPGSWAKTLTMSAFLLPSRNSTSRYCADWKPELVARNGRISAYSLGVSVASTDHWSVSICWMCLTRASRLSAGARSSVAQQRAGRAQLVEHAA